MSIWRGLSPTNRLTRTKQRHPNVRKHRCPSHNLSDLDLQSGHHTLPRTTSLNTLYSRAQGETMSTMTIRMNEQDAELVRKFARFEGVTISDFARAAILEKIEDSYDLQELREAIAQDSGERFSIDEILDDLD